ncbi:MAG: TIR domain-containing protein [Xanthobacteraceae bacterium]
MRVFISWSGAVSRELAELFRVWLPNTLHSVEPFFSPEDATKGATWVPTLFRELDTTSMSIIILTPENLTSSWVMFEAGVISGKVDGAKIFPIVFNMKPSDVVGPLAVFQIIEFRKAEILNLLGTINNAAPRPLSDRVLDQTFKKWWPDLESGVGTILHQRGSRSLQYSLKPDRELIRELLLVAAFCWMRHQLSHWALVSMTHQCTLRSCELLSSSINRTCSRIIKSTELCTKP